MRRLLHPIDLYNRLRSTYWFLPSVITGGAAVCAELLLVVDRAFPRPSGWAGFAYGGGADGARALLSAVAGSTITVVSVTFSVLVVALTVSSQHFGPRVLNNFMRDTPAQAVLGTFTGTFAYCLMVLRTVQGDGDDSYEAFVPHVAVTGAVLLTLFSVGMLIYYVHHVALRLRVSEITASVALDLERAVDRLYPQALGDDAADGGAASVRALPVGAVAVPAPASGYIQEIDSGALVRLAASHGTTLWLVRRPGDFVVKGCPVARAHPAPRDYERLCRSSGGAWEIGADRTSTQDAGFAVQQLVEMALRGLSPGVNEPFTAVNCIDRLAQGLMPLLNRIYPEAARVDADGAVRVVGAPKEFPVLLAEAFESIAVCADRNQNVMRHLLQTLAGLGEMARRPADRQAIARIANFAWLIGSAHARSDSHRASLRHQFQRVNRVLREEDSAAEIREPRLAG